MNAYTKCILVIIGLLYIMVQPASPQEQTYFSNMELTHGDWYFTDTDAVNNEPLEWTRQWLVQMTNGSFGLGDLHNPLIELETDLNLVTFVPEDPNIFILNPPFYTWDYDGVAIPEGYSIGASVQEEPLWISRKPLIHAERHVDPEILASDRTEQILTFSFKIEEPLAPEINNLGIMIGLPLIVFQDIPLTETVVKEMQPVDGWNMWSNGWGIDPANLEIGKEYIFQALLEIQKSPDLIGSPVSKPPILLHFARWEHFPGVVSQSVSVEHPGGVRATLSVDEEILWDTAVTDHRSDIWFNQVVSDVTGGDEPPYTVTIPSNVRIEPETINMKSRGLITTFINLPESYNHQDIDLSTVCCQGAPAVQSNVTKNNLIMKFDRTALQNISSGEEIELWISGRLSDGTLFEGFDTVCIRNSPMR